MGETMRNCVTRDNTEGREKPSREKVINDVGADNSGKLEEGQTGENLKSCLAAKFERYRYKTATEKFSKNKK